MSSAAPSLHPPTPRSFTMPLPLEADKSERSRIAARAFVSATANPQRSAGRLMSAAALTAGSAQKQRRPRTHHQLQLADTMSAAAGAGAVAQQGTPAVATPAHPHAHGQQRASAPSAAGIATAGHPSSSSGGSSTTGSAPTATVAELLLAASGGPSASPTRGIGRGDGRGRVSFSTTAEDDAAMLNALSIALHAEDSYAAAQANAAMRSRRHSRIATATTTAATAPTAQHGRVPALPPALLQSLVRSNMRHVGLSARLKTRAQVRELREAQLECGGVAGVPGVGAAAADNELARQQKLQQAARAAFPAPHATAAAAAAGSRSGSRSRSRSPRRRRPQSSEEEKHNFSHLSAPTLRSPRLRSHQGRGGGGLGARSSRSRGPAAVLKELERELGLPLELHPQPQPQPQHQHAAAAVRAADPPSLAPAALHRPPGGHGGAASALSPQDEAAAGGHARPDQAVDASASAPGYSQTGSAPLSPPPPVRSPQTARSQARSRLLLGSFAPALI